MAEPSTPPSDRLLTGSFVLACLSSFGAFGSFYLLLATLPLYVDHVGGSESEVGLLVGIFSVTALILRLFVGRAADRTGKKRLMVAGALVMTGSSALYLLADGIPSLFALRILHGAGWAVFGTTVNALVADLAPARRRGEAMGVFGMFGNLAMAVGPAVGVALLGSSATGTTSFVALFWTAVAVAAGALAASLALREPARKHPVLRGGGLAAMIEPRSLFPATVQMILALTYGALVSFLPLYAAQRGIGNPGLFFTVYAVTLVAARTFTGRLSDRFGRRAVVAPGLALAALAMLVLAFADGLPWFLAAAVIYGLAFAAAQPTLMAMVVDRARPERRGAAMGTFSTAMDLGIGGGALLWGLVAQAAGYPAVYLGATAVAVLALVVFLAGTRGRAG